MPVKKTEKKATSKVAAKKVIVKKVEAKKVEAKKPEVKKPVIKTVSSKKTVKKTVAAKTPLVKSSSMKLPNLTSLKNKIEPKKLIKPLIVLLVLALVYLIKDEVIVASVNGRPVTRFALIRNLEQQNASTALGNMTLKMLVEQELKKANVVVTAEEMDAELSKIEEQLATQGQNLDDLLEAQGLNRAEVKEQLALSKGLEKLLADKITVSDDEVKSYFESNKDVMGADAKLEEVSENIKAQLKQQKLTSEQQKWFAEIKKTAKINYFKFAPSTNL